MSNTIIRIGRDRGSDIRVDERYDTVSNNHAEIEQRGNELIYVDHSTNGTVINNQKVKNTHVRIYPGDRILLAGVFELGWNDIRRYFPHVGRPTVSVNVQPDAPVQRKTVRLNEQGGGRSGGRSTQPFQPSISNPSSAHMAKDSNYGQRNSYSQAEIDAAIRRWNWGAFFCTWIWAAFHKTYWPMLILVVGLIPYLGQVCSLALCVYLGISGSKIAWECGKYPDFESYKNAQKNWTIIGLILFVIGICFSAFAVYTTLSMF